MSPTHRTDMHPRIVYTARGDRQLQSYEFTKFFKFHFLTNFAVSASRDKKLSYRRGTARCAVSIEIWSTAAHCTKIKS